MQTLKSVSSLPSSGLATISHKAVADLHLPDQSRLLPSEISDISQVDLLFSLPSYDDYITNYLQPYVTDPDVFSPSGFRKWLIQTRNSLRRQAEINPVSAKKFGRLAALLDKEQQLFDLLQLYRSSLVQG